MTQQVKFDIVYPHIREMAKLDKNAKLVKYTYIRYKDGTDKIIYHS
jgi:hypothetical protein